MEAYLDNSATTRVFDEVGDLMLKVMKREYGNPSSLHIKGVEAENYIKDAKEIIARELKVESKEIFFTSGGTESNNLALIGAALANQRAGKHIITTSIEHASIYNPLLFLESLGFKITFLPVDSKGIVDISALKNAICDDTILVSIMMVNNEIGSKQPVEEIGKLLSSMNHKIIFHVDAIQAFGKYKIYPKRYKIDMLSVSGHKIHGPKGSGFIYIKDKTKIKPIIYGGGQQKGMRSGTENVPGIAGLGLATKLIYDNHQEKMERLMSLKAHFIEEITKVGDVINNSGEAPHIISISFPGIRSEVLLHALEERGVYVSSGSACSSNKPGISGTLKAIGVSKESLDSTLRFSLSINTTLEEIDYAIEQVKVLVPTLRKFVRK